MWPSEVREREWNDYLRNFPDGEDILFCLRLWMEYIGDGREHPAIRVRSFKYAMRVLHFYQSYDTQTLGNWWKERIQHFGLKHDPATNEFEIVNKDSWRHAISILRQSDHVHNGRGRLPWRYFLKRIESGVHWSEPIDENEFPPTKRKERAFNQSPEPVKPEREHQSVPFGPPSYNPVRNYVFKLTEEM